MAVVLQHQAYYNPVLKNETIRKIKKTIKLDRIRFSSDIKQWKKNTSYSVGDTIQYNNEAYTVGTAFTSSNTFDSTYMTVKLENTFDNAMDRTMAYYKPNGNVDDADYKEKLGMVFKGITSGTNKGPCLVKILI